MLRILLTYATTIFFTSLSFSSTTQIIPTQCGTTLPTLSTAISATLVANATSYKFRVELDGQFYEVERTLRTFKLTDLPVYRYAATYYVQVAAKVNGSYGTFGEVCEITSPTPITWLTDSMCNITLTSMDQVIYANAVTNAPGYRFRVTNTANAEQVFIVDRTLREFRMSLIGAPSNSSYLVDVAIKNFDGTYLPYGPSCLVTTPSLTTELEEIYCGKLLGALSEDIYANALNFATAYRFKVTDILNPANETIIENTLRTFDLSMVPFIQYDKPYTVAVAVRDQAGEWQMYGPSCTVYTPKMPIPKIQLSQCDHIATSMDEVILADAILNATAYRFRLQTATYSQWIDRPLRSFSLSMFNGLLPDTEYTVRVAVKVGGTYSAYGKACTITTPSASASSRMAYLVNPVQHPVAYPNPFTDSFAIKWPISGNMPTKIYILDSTGRVIEEHVSTADDLSNLAIGTNLPLGMYLVRIENQENQYHVRVLKK